MKKSRIEEFSNGPLFCLQLLFLFSFSPPNEHNLRHLQERREKEKKRYANRNETKGRCTFSWRLRPLSSPLSAWVVESLSLSLSLFCQKFEFLIFLTLDKDPILEKAANSLSTNEEEEMQRICLFDYESGEHHR